MMSRDKDKMTMKLHWDFYKCIADKNYRKPQR
jgi:hypothetical protein